jgi:NADPH:quinone reductase-like Zn-dependent oxidoreductase
MARLFGAHVTAICSTGNVNISRSIGAADIIDYTQNDFTKTEDRYDLLLTALETIRCPHAGAF